MLRKNLFLKNNADQIHKAIKEVFAGAEGIELRGELVHFDYADEDCSDLRHIGSRMTPANYGPGIRIAVKFNDQQIRRFFYPEKECNSIEEFLDNLNTDFGMTQIMHGNATKYLGITHYDLNSNLICFEIGYNNNIEKKLFNSCWDVNNLTFNLNEFMSIKSNAEKEAGIQKLVYRGFFAPTMPASIKVLGIDKEAFLKQTKSLNNTI